mmetsp:Transcript_5409/g.7316  ORF Transcript_5409/g.7316 Transcript_5409/m.7316 type:complete len:199 (+) Transcript_5409:327-923(+)|eukprot:CAMPEP_0196582100 /NCGR_PEP_ID=MMETSP1081-20130531/37489_1 /TAXON_ID=36882 /ORGANISM="Pyramimonas amylifera, Strain CCMP720" /LENGTH=198 /DNA_ID=CAMNT_0041902579 /DNA_START=326 /DNA_END=922 /DNA_ORIENTATION=-
MVKDFEKESMDGEVRVNVYDLWEKNDCLYLIGFGIYHSGVEVYDSEYAYGAHDFSSSGVFETAPRTTPGTAGFRGSVLVGRTRLSPQEVEDLCDQLGDEYRGNQYHLLSRNCNHFTNSLTKELTGKSSPGWINRLAYLGLCCACILPPGLNPPLPAPPQSSSQARLQLSEDDNQPLINQGGKSATTSCPVPHPTMQRI